jgi:hypothetical protein
MYFILKVWNIWVFFDKVNGKSRLISNQELDLLRGLYPLFVQGPANSLLALQVSYLPLSKLQQRKTSDPTDQSDGNLAEPIRYISCKVANNWTIYERSDEDSRSMTSEEIAFVRSVFSALVDQASSMVEAIQVSDISLSRLQQLTQPVEGNLRAAVKPGTGADKK